MHLLRDSLGEGIHDALALLRARSIGVLAGSLGWVAFDVAVLGACFEAFGHSPAIGVLALGYLIGQLGGNIPIPGGIGGVDAGLIGTFPRYHQPLAATTAAVLVYHAIALWVPALSGSVAFVQLRRALQREALPAAMHAAGRHDPNAGRSGAGAVSRCVSWCHAHGHHTSGRALAVWPCRGHPW